ncbi:hypothetical protein Agub_g9124, partial [Astrephomene gubernaculifera]
MAAENILARVTDFLTKENDKRRCMADSNAVMLDECQGLLAQTTQRVYQLRSRDVVVADSEGGSRKKPAKKNDPPSVPAPEQECKDAAQSPRQDGAGPSSVQAGSIPADAGGQAQRVEEEQDQKEAGPSAMQPPGVGQKRGRQTTRSAATSKRAKAKPTKPAEEAPPAAPPVAAPTVAAPPSPAPPPHPLPSSAPPPAAVPGPPVQPVGGVVPIEEGTQANKLPSNSAGAGGAVADDRHDDPAGQAVAPEAPALEEDKAVVDIPPKARARSRRQQQEPRGNAAEADDGAAGTSAPAAPAFSPRVTRSRRGGAGAAPPPPAPAPTAAAAAKPARNKGGKQKRDMKEAQLGSPGLHPKTKLATDANVSSQHASPAGDAGPSAGAASGLKRLPALLPLLPSPQFPPEDQQREQEHPQQEPQQRQHQEDNGQQEQQEREQLPQQQREEREQQPEDERELAEEQKQQPEQEQQQDEVQEQQEHEQQQQREVKQEVCEERLRSSGQPQQQQNPQHQHQQPQQEKSAVARTQIGNLPSAVKAAVALFESAKTGTRSASVAGGAAKSAARPKPAAGGEPSTSHVNDAHGSGSAEAAAPAVNIASEPIQEEEAEGEGGFCFGTQLTEHSSPDIPHFRQAAEHDATEPDGKAGASDVVRISLAAASGAAAVADDAPNPDELGPHAMELQQPKSDKEVALCGSPVEAPVAAADDAVGNADDAVEESPVEAEEDEAAAGGDGIDAVAAAHAEPRNRSLSLSLAVRSPSAAGLACSPVLLERPEDDGHPAAEARDVEALEEAPMRDEEAMQQSSEHQDEAAIGGDGDEGPVTHHDGGEDQGPTSSKAASPCSLAAGIDPIEEADDEGSADEANEDDSGEGCADEAPVADADDEGCADEPDDEAPVVDADGEGSADEADEEAAVADADGEGCAGEADEEGPVEDAGGSTADEGNTAAASAAARKPSAAAAQPVAATAVARQPAVSPLKPDGAAPRPLEAGQPSKPKGGNLISCVRSFLPTRTAPSPPPAAGRAVVEVKALRAAQKAAQAAKEKEAARAAERAQRAERQRHGQPDVANNAQPGTARQAPVAHQGAAAARPTPAPSASQHDVATASACTAGMGAAPLITKSTAVDEHCNGTTATSTATATSMSVRDKLAFFQAREELAKRSAAELGAGRKPATTAAAASQGAAPSYKAGAAARATHAAGGEDNAAATASAAAPIAAGAAAPSASTATSFVPVASPRPMGRPPAAAGETAADKHKRVEARRKEEEERRRAELEARNKAKDDKMRNFEAAKQQRLGAGVGAGAARPPAPPAAGNPVAAGKRPAPNAGGAGPYGVTIKPEPENNRTGPTGPSVAKTPAPKAGFGTAKTPATKAAPLASSMVSPAVQMQVKLLPAVHAKGGAAAGQVKPQAGTSVGVNLPAATNATAQGGKQLRQAAGAAAGSSQQAPGIENSTPGGADLTEEERRHVHAIQTSPYIAQVKPRTPGVTTATKPQFNSYEISPYKSDSDAGDSDDEDSPRPRKPLPEWAAPDKV